MNSKIIIPLIFLFVIIGAAGIYSLQAPAQPATSDLQGIILYPSVKGCAETDQGKETRSLSGGTVIEPEISVNGNEVLYSRAINHLCCRKAEIEKETDNSVINIYEVWSGIGCKCICFSEIEAKLQNIPSGTYTVNVYEKGTQAASEEPMDQTLIISQNIVIQ